GLLHYRLVLLSWRVDGCLVDELQFFAVLDPDAIGPLLPASILEQLARLIDVELPLQVLGAEALGVVEEVCGGDARASGDVVLHRLAVDEHPQRLPDGRVGQQRMFGLDAGTLAVDFGPGVGAVELDVLDVRTLRHLDPPLAALLESPENLELARTCASCGAQLSPTTKFCPECAHPTSVPQSRFVPPETYTPKHLAEQILTSKPALEGERKLLTVLFAELEGSMELLADRDPEEARGLLDPALERMMDAVHHYEGTVNEVRGDGITALFGAPIAHEDHAARACYAALRMREAVKRYADEVRRSEGPLGQIRVGISSGEGVGRSIGSDLLMDYAAVGRTTYWGGRMGQCAGAGVIWFTAETLRLAEGFVEINPLDPVAIKGLAEPVEVFELVGAGAARTRLDAAARRGLTRFVGRGTKM